MKKQLQRLLITAMGMGFIVVPAIASAAPTPTLNQTVNAGTLSTNVLQTDDVTPVASPTVAFSALNTSFACQTSTATLGDTNNKLNVTNLAANNGFTLTMAPTAGFTATWSDGASHTYKFNDATGGTAGCTNGQLTVNPSVATLTDDCSGSCNDSTVTKGSSTAYNHTTSTDSVTLLTNTSGTSWEGYLTGISLSQKVPASQHSGSYTLPMTITVTAQ